MLTRTSEPGFYWVWANGGVICETEAEAKAMLARMGCPNATVEKRYVTTAEAGNADKNR